MKGIPSLNFGQIALAALIICGTSGGAIVLPYDPAQALKSVSALILFNPAAAFFRDLHYWSGQLFLVSTVVHFFQHFRFESIRRTRPAIWMRLVASLPVLMFLMISGFILKGDRDGLQALNLIRYLFHQIPGIGPALAAFLTGTDQNLTVIYLIHAAPATALIILVVYEHARTVWPSRGYFLSGLFLSGGLALLFQAPVGDLSTESLKGPWFFLGFQEILHWLPSSPWIFLIISLVLIPSFFVFRLNPAWQEKIRFYLFTCLILYGFVTVTGLMTRGSDQRLHWQGFRNWLQETTLPVFSPGRFFETFPDSVPTLRTSLISGRHESCMVCHGALQGFDRSHPPAAIGCTSCHLGQPFTREAQASHRGMVLVPGNLADARKTCGTTECHPGIPNRLDSSIMTTLSGMITTDRWVFGEETDLNFKTRVSLLGDSPADIHLRTLCTGCHLGQARTVPGSTRSGPLGGGCNACHLRYKAPYEKLVHQYYSGNNKGKVLPSYHPGLSVDVDDQACEGCHNRSGRIATTYAGLAETLQKPESGKYGKDYRILDGYRPFLIREDDVHHRGGMGCTDCHGPLDVMGDGQTHAHKEEAVKTTCLDCHSHRPKLVAIENADPDAQKILSIRKVNEPGARLLASSDGASVFTNTRLVDKQIVLSTRKGNKPLKIKQTNPECTAKIHQALDCNTCHTGWAPTCIGCHTHYAPSEIGYDHSLSAYKMGTWKEDAGIFEARSPALGVRLDFKGKRRIGTYIPGMILTIGDAKTEDAGSNIHFERLFSPISAHNTQRKSRSCKSCHLNPAALGYGEGKLDFVADGKKGRWVFSPRFAPNPHDQLPEDAWVGFLKVRSGKVATRKNHRPFSIEEQKRILEVGSCLTCHREDSKVVVGMLTDYPSQIKNRSEYCIPTDW